MLVLVDLEDFAFEHRYILTVVALLKAIGFEHQLVAPPTSFEPSDVTEVPNRDNLQR
jgi:hypothetical protein